MATIEMPTAIYDSSYLTFRRRAGVLSAYNSALATASTTDYNVVRKEQPTLQTLEVVTTRRQGACFCTGGSIQNDMRSATGPCSCAR
jgi:hypothetical protein